MKIYADEQMPLVQQFFAEFGEICLFNGRALPADAIADADILLVRSVTQVNEALLAQNSRLQFVGTATIGMDHIDQVYLKQRQIPFYSAPGCNAQSVVEYVLSSLFFLAEKYQWNLSEKVVGIVGVGNIGRRLVKALQALQIPFLLSDPIRAAAEPDFPHIPFENLCQQADILTFHVPMTKTGPYASWHLLNQQTLTMLKPDCAVINAARGSVIDNQALLAEAQAGHQRPLVLDVWEQEPDILLPLLPYLDIATAHIAGHSIEGKARGTEMLYRQWCLQQQKPIKYQLANFLPQPVIEKIRISQKFGLPDVQKLVRMVYDVRRDDSLFRYYIRRNGFDWLRKTYPARREFSALHLSGTAIPDWLVKLGFSCQ